MFITYARFLLNFKFMYKYTQVLILTEPAQMLNFKSEKKVQSYK